MKPRAVLVFLVIFVCLLAGGTAQAGPPASTGAQPGTATGNLYRLIAREPASLAAPQGGGWRTVGTATGAIYALAPGAEPSGTGTPCCCTHLPCVMR